MGRWNWSSICWIKMGSKIFRCSPRKWMKKMRLKGIKIWTGLFIGPQLSSNLKYIRICYLIKKSTIFRTPSTLLVKILWTKRSPKCSTDTVFLILISCRKLTSSLKRSTNWGNSLTLLPAPTLSSHIIDLKGKESLSQLQWTPFSQN